MLTAKNSFIRRVEIQRDKIESFSEYPFSIPSIKSMYGLDLHPNVNFFVGENGAGKSTLLEAIAVHLRLNPEGGSKHLNFSTQNTHSSLHEFTKLIKGPSQFKDAFFLRAESFYNVASKLSEVGSEGYGEKSLHDQSHGESFFSLFMNRFGGKGLYLMDEPEAALSPMRQLSLVTLIHELVRSSSQLIIATHSPIILAYPNAKVFNFSENGIEVVKYQETEHFQVYRNFINRPDRMIKRLIHDE